MPVLVTEYSLLMSLCSEVFTWKAHSLSHGQISSYSFQQRDIERLLRERRLLLLTKQIRRTLTLTNKPFVGEEQWKVWAEVEEWQKARPHLGYYKVRSGTLAPPYSYSPLSTPQRIVPLKGKSGYATW